MDEWQRILLSLGYVTPFIRAFAAGKRTYEAEQKRALDAVGPPRHEKTPGLGLRV